VVGEGAAQQLAGGDGRRGLVRGGAHNTVDSVTEVLSSCGNCLPVRGDDRGHGSQPSEDLDIAVVAQRKVANGSQIGLRACQQAEGLAGPLVVDAGKFG
jgi:hypothetical protein